MKLRSNIECLLASHSIDIHPHTEAYELEMESPSSSIGRHIVVTQEDWMHPCEYIQQPEIEAGAIDEPHLTRTHHIDLVRPGLASRDIIAGRAPCIARMKKSAGQVVHTSDSACCEAPHWIAERG